MPMSDTERDTTYDPEIQNMNKNQMDKHENTITEKTDPIKTDIVYNGTCRWYNAEKGYGFLAADDNMLPRDAWVHISNINTNNSKDPSDIQLHTGQPCTFQIQLKKNSTSTDELRIAAVNVVPGEFAEKKSKQLMSKPSSESVCIDNNRTKENEKSSLAKDLDNNECKETSNNEDLQNCPNVLPNNETSQNNCIDIEMGESIDGVFKESLNADLKKRETMRQNPNENDPKSTTLTDVPEQIERTELFTRNDKIAENSAKPKKSEVVERTSKQVSAKKDKIYEGVCLRFDEKKGFGFLRIMGDRNGYPDKIFVHRKCVKNNVVLQVGQKARFRVLMVEKDRFKAVEVIPEKFSIDPQSFKVHKGVVTVFFKERGFGFIKGSDGDERVFVHRENVIGQAFLSPDQAVEYKVRNQINTKDDHPTKKEAFDVVPGKVKKTVILSGTIASFDPKTGNGVIKCASPDGEIKKFAFSQRNVKQIKSAQKTSKNKEIGKPGDSVGEGAISISIGQTCTFTPSVDRKNKPCAIKITVMEKVLTDGDYLGFEPYLPEHFEQAKAIRKRIEQKEALERKQNKPASKEQNVSLNKKAKDSGKSQPEYAFGDKTAKPLTKSQKKKLKRKQKKTADVNTAEVVGKTTEAMPEAEPITEPMAKSLNQTQTQNEENGNKASVGSETGLNTEETLSGNPDSHLSEEKVPSDQKDCREETPLANETKVVGRKKARRRPPKSQRIAAMKAKAEDFEKFESDRAKKVGKKSNKGKNLENPGSKGGKKREPKGNVKGSAKDGKRRESRDRANCGEIESSRGFFSSMYGWLFGGLV